MKLEKVRKIAVAAFCAVLAAGNIWTHVRVPEDESGSIVFYERQVNGSPAEDAPASRNSAADNYALSAGNNSADNRPTAGTDAANEGSDTAPEGTPEVLPESRSGSLVNINSASFEQLLSLPGIGEVKARAIMEYRENYGGFVAPQEIMEVKGIGQATYDKLKDRIAVE